MSRFPYWRFAGFYFFYFCYLGAFAPYFSLYLTAHQLNPAQIGAVMALPQLTRIIGPQLWAWIADHGGKPLAVSRWTTLAGIAAFCVLFKTDGFLRLYAVVFTMSFFLSAALPLTEAATVNFLGGDTGRYARVRLWGSIGFIVSVASIGFALDRLPIIALLWMMLAVLVGWMVFLLRVPEAPEIEHAHDHPPIKDVILRPEVLALIIACALMAVAHGPYYTFYSIYMVDHGYSKTAIGWLWSLGVVCEIGVFYFAPYLFKRFSLRTVLLTSFALATVRFLLIGWGSQWFALVLLAQVLHAASFGSFHASAFAYIQRFFKGKHMARGQGIYSGFTFGFGGTIGAMGAGYAWEHVGPGWTYTIAAMCAAAGGLLAAARLGRAAHSD